MKRIKKYFWAAVEKDGSMSYFPPLVTADDVSRIPAIPPTILKYLSRPAWKGCGLAIVMEIQDVAFRTIDCQIIYEWSAKEIQKLLNQQQGLLE